jgi:hypothetical protein
LPRHTDLESATAVIVQANWSRACAKRPGTLNRRQFTAAIPFRGVRVQRLHEGDLSGHVLERGTYEHLCSPSEFEPETPFGDSVADAARVAGIGTETLYRWMRYPALVAEYRAAAVAAFGPAMMLAQQRMGDAVTVIRGLAVDPAILEETRLLADLYIADAVKVDAMEDLSAA